MKSLPKGLKASVKAGSLRITGTVKKAGIYHATVLAKDEMGNIITDKLTLLIGDADKVVAAATPKYLLTTIGGTASGSFALDAEGGTGAYTYRYRAAQKVKGLTVQEDGIVEAQNLKPGTYKQKVTVTDRKGHKTSMQVTVIVKRGYRIRGKFADSKGKTVKGKISAVYCKDLQEKNAGFEDLYEINVKMQSGTFEMYLPAGIYCIDAVRSAGNWQSQTDEVRGYLAKQKIYKNVSGLKIVIR